MSLQALKVLYLSVVLGRRIPNPGVSGSKSLGGSKVNSAFHLSEVDQKIIKNSW